MFAIVSFVFLIPIVAVITWVALKQVSPLQDKEQPAAASGNIITTTDKTTVAPNTTDTNTDTTSDTADTTGDVTDTPPDKTDSTLPGTGDPADAGTTNCATKTKGDANCDGEVALDDWTIISEEYKAKCTETKAELCGDDEDSNGEAIDSDFDGDGVVGVSDISIWNSNLKSTDRS